MTSPLAADVAIVLSSYNGSGFIAQQIESIRQQTVAGWRLLVRDDGSTDETVQIVDRLARADPRILLIRDRHGNLGPAHSFGLLLEHARDLGAPYVALSDQDDVWLPRKLELGLAAIREGESDRGTETPLLVHTDLAVVDEHLAPIAASFMAFQGLQPVAHNALGRLLIQNFVTGCTAIVNRALLRAALPFPEIVMHDWWLALCAAAMGQVRLLPEATVLYRQHGRNTLGSQDWREVRRATLRRPFAWWQRSSRMFTQAVHQGCELALRVEREHRHSGVDYPARAALSDFCAAFREPGISAHRLRVVRRHRIAPKSLLPYPVCYYARVLLGVRPLPPGAKPGTSSSTAGAALLGSEMSAVFTPKE